MNLAPVLIVAIVMFALVMKARYRSLGNGSGGSRRHRLGLVDEERPAEPRIEAENARLKDEVQQLKERVKVLERIAVDKENSLAREIDQLRDR